ncbi:molybdopterin synthase catalytic subunit [Aspergillus undulatus]|uniref:molybdopterin synthase catalytic subunit n=1 Tax=Aspergillus undulatus TaxID=1810928 RepID=UPI003CCD19AE
MPNRPEPQPQPDQTSSSALPLHLDPTTYPRTLTTTTLATPDSPAAPIHLELTYAPLSPDTALKHISSPSSGANILFLGTTRDTFEDRRVAQLSYTSYPALALKSLKSIAENAVSKYGLGAVYIAHRLGVVPIQEASIVVAVGSGHRGEGWAGAEGILEDVKERVEVWKREEFVDGGAEWRENRERDARGNLIQNKEKDG